MADRATRRLVVDLVFAAALVACGITVHAMNRAPAVPATVCESTHGGPRYDAMLDDGHLTIAAVFGELVGGPTDPNAWSYRAFAAGLRARGFVETGPDRFQRENVTIDLALIANDPADTSAALAGALASHDVVYYNGHSHGGDIVFDPPADYRLIVLDSCWSTQRYAERLIAANRDVMTNTERSVTGSIESMFVLLDALLAREPAWPLAEMNARAEYRARLRAPLSKYKEAERYRVDVPCP